jgi:hypothetical protein
MKSPAELYGRWKSTHSKPIYEDIVTIHLSFKGKILCGIDKRFPDLYEKGFDPVEHNNANKNTCCQLCRKVAEKRHNW